MIRSRVPAAARIVVLAALVGTVFAGQATLAAPAPTQVSATPAPAAMPAATTSTLTTIASAAVPIGGAIHDSATLSGAVSLTGVVTFTVFGPNDPNVPNCSGSPVAKITATVAGAGPYTSPDYTPTSAGTYDFEAAYGGDANNVGSASPCGSPGESVTVSKVTPTVVTATQPNAVLGGVVTDTATISGGFSPTGTVTWSLYGPNDPNCTSTPMTAAPVAVNLDGSYVSPAFTPDAPGPYSFSASYSGDSNNAAVPGTCGATGNRVAIQAQPTLTTQASPSAPLGGSVSATATLAFGSSPTGTILFSLYAPGDTSCSGSPLVTSTATVTGNGSFSSASYTPTTNGSYRFTAAYSGDAVNLPVNASCGATGESVLVGKAVTALATTASAPVPVFGSIFDDATLAGGADPTGTITFDLYNLNDPTCAGPIIYAPTATVDGNGTYSSGSVEGGAPGSFNWAVSYSGDANNEPASSSCGSPGETSVVFGTGPNDGAAGSGYWLLAADGGIFNYGTAGFLGSAASIHLNKPIVAMAATPDRKGYLIVASDGGVFIYGDAGYYGSAAMLHLNSPIVGMASTPDRKGYWMVAADGGVFAYGDARFFGSAGSLHLNSPIVGMVASADGGGYWMVAADGGIFAYGDATFSGSAGSLHLNKAIVGMAAMSSGGGYWLVASDGGIFSYGSAEFLGSTGSTHLNKAIVGMAATSDGGGYWLAASDGGVFAYGDAAFRGSAGGSPLNRPIVGIAGG